ncbi:MAG: TetR/AcrR family transcriptional regulator [Pseudomonadota bacterium]
MPQVRSQTRQKIISSAARLFYGEGIRAVSMDAVAEAAGFTKKTLYYHFSSKDDLVAAYLQSQDEPAIAAYQRWFNGTDGDVGDKVAGMFAGFADTSRKPKWRGCGFLRTVAELANMPGHPAIKVGRDHKRKFESWLTDALEAHAVPHANRVAREVFLLLEGAATVMLFEKDTAYVFAASALAKRLVVNSSP